MVINIRPTGNKLKNCDEKYTGYIIKIKKHTIKGWNRIYMGKTKKKIEKSFILDDYGLNNLKNYFNQLLNRKKIAGYKLKAIVGPDLGGGKYKIIMGWKFV